VRPFIQDQNRLALHADFTSQNAAAAGNLLANPNIPEAMVTAFHQGTGHLGDRLIDAMRAALALGGEAGALHSAGLLLVGEQEWPMADLRCDWTEDCPIEAGCGGMAYLQASDG
jgi:uncharacterized Ntn-hydrolase superfamily protein